MNGMGAMFQTAYPIGRKFEKGCPLSKYFFLKRESEIII